MPIAVGTQVPADPAGFVLSEQGPAKTTLGEVTAGKKIVMFGVPGAFTGTCTNEHLPSYLREAEALGAKGVDGIVCLAANDVFVLDAWNSQHGGREITMLSDGNGEIAAALDLAVDLGAVGFGRRVTRFAAVIDDGTVTSLDVEENPGVCSVSAAGAILAKL